MFVVHRSNRVDVLVERLADLVREPGPDPDPFAREVIVVASRGMERWLAMRLAERLGVSAATEYPFPRSFLDRLLAEVEPDPVEALSPEVARWRLARLLGERADDPAFAEIAPYLEGPLGERKRIELAAELGELFDRYAIHRPDLVRRWLAGHGGAAAGRDETRRARLEGGAAGDDERRPAGSEGRAEGRDEGWPAGSEGGAEGRDEGSPAGLERGVDGLHEVWPPQREDGRAERGGDERGGDERERTVREGGAVGRDERWQAELFRRLVAESRVAPIGERVGRLVRALGASAFDRRHLPRRLSLFGLSTLPPLYVDAFAALARRIDVHLFLVSPSDGWWADLRSRREIIRAARKSGQPPEDLHLTEGHALLASLGRLGRELQQLLEERVDYVEDEACTYVDPGEGTLLATIQADMLALVDRGARGDVAPHALAPGDDSIRVHACVSPMREVEALKDQLLDLFARDATLAPADVIVMTPDIETYLPYVEAVFGVSDEHATHVPHRVADRPVLASHTTVRAFLAVLDVLEGRFRASEILDLLAFAEVRDRFDLAAEDLDTVRLWVERAGIRWGVDADHRAELGQPALAGGTWRFGLDRLLLGHAMAGEEAGRLFGGTLPVDDVEGGTADLLGRFAELLERLFAAREDAKRARSVGAWSETLLRLLDRTVATTESNAYQHQRLREALVELGEQAAGADFREPISLGSLRFVLERALSTPSRPVGFLAGGVTFCELVPMRSIPFRVVCLLGLDEDGFPRQRRPRAFDLMARGARRPGDRSVREDDRYLFLEALLSAREHFVVTYVGQSQQDLSERSPSVVVGELLDHLDAAFVAGDGRPVREHVVVRHPIQAFSARYFDGRDERLFSYDPERLAEAEHLTREPAPPQPFFAAPLAALAPNADDDVSLASLAAFLRDPAAALLARLDVRLTDEPDALADRELAELTGLERWKAGDRLLAYARTGAAPARFDAEGLRLLDAAGLLPLGTVGRLVHAELDPEVRAILALGAEELADAELGAPRPPLERLESGRPLAPLEPREVRIDLGEHGHVYGVLDSLTPAGREVRTFTRLKASLELGLWVHHLALAAAGFDDVPVRSVLVARAREKRGAERLVLGRVAEPRRVLAELVALYRLGLTRPLAFFPVASRRYVDVLRGRSPARALGAARATFRGSRHQQQPAEAELPQVVRLFGGVDPISERPLTLAGAPPAPAFTDLARAVWEPFLACRQTGGDPR